MPPPLRPPPYAVDERSLESQTRVEVFTAGGPGGQHRNKTQNGVRLHHAPSGVVITATERRSLEANRRAAFERLAERLRKLNYVPKKRKATRPTHGSVERRLAGKAHAARTKATRRRSYDD
jgi:protein subunit release factor B